MRSSTTVEQRIDERARRFLAAAAAGGPKVLLTAVVLVFGRCVMHFRVFRREFRMPLVVSFLLVAWVYKPRPPEKVDGRRREVPSTAQLR
ncbi:DUF817 family protein [Arthrobacter sp. ISL-85]|uniref:DUF817 family protein n=1 Tax=Arthrobacter sp. ISL-85 TaxID=2819115 RepID=UPI0037C09127